ncbi:MAG: hypothetical protein LBL34_01295 [Clostridiales bacterium]|jgi:hypothetical protein|nr:hypothetical protein [Clostridiales bacterium]
MDEQKTTNSSGIMDETEQVAFYDISKNIFKMLGGVINEENIGVDRLSKQIAELADTSREYISHCKEMVLSSPDTKATAKGCLSALRKGLISVEIKDEDGYEYIQDKIQETTGRLDEILGALRVNNVNFYIKEPLLADDSQSHESDVTISIPAHSAKFIRQRLMALPSPANINFESFREENAALLANFQHLIRQYDLNASENPSQSEKPRATDTVRTKLYDISAENSREPSTDKIPEDIILAHLTTLFDKAALDYRNLDSAANYKQFYAALDNLANYIGVLSPRNPMLKNFTIPNDLKPACPLAKSGINNDKTPKKTI